MNINDNNDSSSSPSTNDFSSESEEEVSLGEKMNLPTDFDEKLLIR
jgi:hypothetical protein